MQQRLLLIVLSLSMFLSYGQGESASANFSGPKENIHLHLNKTTFLRGERIWFKAYVRDQNTKRPSLETTNLHVGIFGDDGKEVKRKLLYVENGMAQGDFGIDSSLVDSEYTVLAWTNYMRNFRELEPFRQRIRILRDGQEEETGDVNMSISIYPEGGQLIAGAYNNMGILVDNGLGQGVKVDNLELIDETGKIIRSNIKTNFFGMGKIGFLAETQKRYFLQRQRPDGSLVRTVVPKAIEGQLGLSIDNNGKDRVLLTLLASKATFSERDGEVYTMALYQNDFIRFEELEVNENETVLSMDRNELPFGILTTVLFDMELRPIAYRMFFNDRTDDNTLQNVEIEHCLTAFGDSVQVDLIMPKGLKGSTNISLSALPYGTDARHPDNSIVSSFLLRPYVQHQYQEHYFFENMDRRKRYELDNRLLIEGWGKYNWDSRKQKKVQLAFEMETAIPFKGRVLDANLEEENQISMIAELSSAMGFEELDENKSFKGAMRLFDGDSLGISLLSKKGKLRKPKVEFGFLDHESTIPELMEIVKPKVLKRQATTIKDQSINEPFNIGKRTIALDEVTVMERALKTKKTDMFIPNGTLLPISEGGLIGDNEIKRFGSVTRYLNKLGYNRSIGLDADGFEVDILLSPKSNLPVLVDNTLLNLPLSRVQAIYYDVDKKVYVTIVLRPNAYEKPEDRNKFLKFVVENGYTRPQDYFTPNYTDYNGQLFRTYGALDWKANLLVHSDLPTSINIPIKNQRAIQLHVEGMSSIGYLISLSKEISLNEVLESKK